MFGGNLATHLSYMEYQFRLVSLFYTSNRGNFFLCSETIVDTDRIIVSRKSFRTLAPTEWVDSEVVPYVSI